MTSEISNFRGEFGFLSNFAPCRLALDGKFYTSAEHAYQASKAVNETDREAIGTASSPVKAKRLGKVLIQIRPDWEEVKADVMLRILRQKFSSPTLKSRLLGTGDTELIEGNVWGDKEWGCVMVDGKWQGKNLLGKTLMMIREELRK